MGPLSNEVRLHDMWCYYDPKIMLRFLDVMLCILPDMAWETVVTADGKSIVYNLKPVTTDPIGFVDPDNLTIKNPATAAIVKYFSGGLALEPYKYAIELPEAIDSNVRNERFVRRQVKTVDREGRSVIIQQKVAVILTFVISGQKSGSA
ncbi:hypothetical protein BDR26DRAFT_1017540 [Obelidium mucronatum]|nr:hypothetical protein BDR26DRAFT_1017540 [Obelidium mucronatum]